MLLLGPQQGCPTEGVTGRQHRRAADGVDGGQHLGGEPVALDGDPGVRLLRCPVPAEVEPEAVERGAEMRDDGRPHPGVEAVSVRQQQGRSVATQVVQGGVLAVVVSQLPDVHTWSPTLRCGRAPLRAGARSHPPTGASCVGWRCGS